MTQQPLAILLSLFLFSNTWAFDQNRIIGDNDLVVVDASASNIPLKYKNVVNAFGLLNMGCTATHIGNGYVLTAGHCFWVGSDLSLDLPCDDTTVEWGVREGISPYMKSTCQRIIAAQKNLKNDFAIIKVFPVPTASIDVELQRKASVRDSITIFSHPEMLPLRWSKICTIVIAVGGPYKDTLQHKCDTKGGSSGASILDATTNRIVGIHNGGLDKPGADAGSVVNYGTFLSNTNVADQLIKLGF